MEEKKTEDISEAIKKMIDGGTKYITHFNNALGGLDKILSNYYFKQERNTLQIRTEAVGNIKKNIENIKNIGNIKGEQHKNQLALNSTPITKIISDISLLYFIYLNKDVKGFENDIDNIKKIKDILSLIYESEMTIYGHNIFMDGKREKIVKDYETKTTIERNKIEKYKVDLDKLLQEKGYTLKLENVIHYIESCDNNCSPKAPECNQFILNNSPILPEWCNDLKKYKAMFHPDKNPGCKKQANDYFSEFSNKCDKKVEELSPPSAELSPPQPEPHPEPQPAQPAPPAPPAAPQPAPPQPAPPAPPAAPQPAPPAPQPAPAELIPISKGPIGSISKLENEFDLILKLNDSNKILGTLTLHKNIIGLNDEKLKDLSNSLANQEFRTRLLELVKAHFGAEIKNLGLLMVQFAICELNGIIGTSMENDDYLLADCINAYQFEHIASLIFQFIHQLSKIEKLGLFPAIKAIHLKNIKFNKDGELSFIFLESLPKSTRPAIYETDNESLISGNAWDLGVIIYNYLQNIQKDGKIIVRISNKQFGMIDDFLIKVLTDKKPNPFTSYDLKALPIYSYIVNRGGLDYSKKVLKWNKSEHKFFNESIDIYSEKWEGDWELIYKPLNSSIENFKENPILYKQTMAEYVKMTSSPSEKSPTGTQSPYRKGFNIFRSFSPFKRLSKSARSLSLG